jgi:glycosyltransferase involved in cell wall biosynthesis
MDEYYNVDNIQNEVVEILPKWEQKEHVQKQRETLKIVFVTFLKYPNTGGLSNYITSLKTGLEKRGHEVNVLSPVQMPPIYFEKHIPKVAANARDFLWERYGIENEKIIKNISYLHAFSSFLQQQNLEEYDVIHAEDLFAMFLLGKLNVVYKKPLFFTPHGYFTRSRVKFGKIKKGSLEEIYFSEIEKQGICMADKIITISDSFHVPLQEYGATEEQLVTVHTGIAFQPATPVKKGKHFVITSIARLAPRKGHDILLKAIARIQHELKQVEIWIVGEGVMRESLEKEVEKLGIRNVIFFGRRTDIAELLASSTIYVLPTLNDNFPIAIIEAMFAGKAIITTNCGGIVEMIHPGETGLLCEPGNVEQLVQALQILLTDESLRTKLGKQAQVYAQEHFTQEKMATKMERIYKSFLGRLEM